MSDENIHIKSNDGDKIIVKDNTQIIKLQGPKGEPGLQGPQDLLVKTELTEQKVNKACKVLLGHQEETELKVNKEFLDHLAQKVNRSNIPILLLSN